jgi:beta-phosphoglucomutase-like phosphatase (HAD superfamily)
MEARNQWLMLSFVEVETGNTALQQAQAEARHILTGRVYGVKMCLMSNQRERVNARTERMPLIDLTEFFVSASDVSVLHKPAGASHFIRTRSEH